MNEADIVNARKTMLHAAAIWHATIGSDLSRISIPTDRRISMSAPYEGDSNEQVIPGLKGVNTRVRDGIGVLGESQNFEGVHGISHTAFAGVGGYESKA